MGTEGKQLSKFVPQFRNDIAEWARNLSIFLSSEFGNLYGAINKLGYDLGILNQVDYEETVYPETYGAKGDGVSDDTAAIQAALNEAGAKDYKLFFGAKIYCHAGITLPEHITIEGCGAKNTILRYTLPTGNGIDLGAASVQNILNLKVDAVPGSTGSAIYSSPAIYTRDFYIDRYEIEGFDKGIYIPYGLEIYVGFGRLIGPGKNTAGSIGITLGDHALPAGITVNAATIRQAYISSYETNNMLKGTIHKVDGAISESCMIAYDYHCRLVVSGSWVQADTFLFQNTIAGWGATSLCNLLYDGIGAEVDDVTAMVNLANTNDLQVVSQSGDFKGAGNSFRARYATSLARAIQVGHATLSPVYLYNNAAAGTLTIESASGVPLATNRTEAGARVLFGVQQNGVYVGGLGVDASGNLRILTGAAFAAAVANFDINKNVWVGEGAINVAGTDGFLYIPTCAGTPVGVPTAKAGFSPLVIDSTNHKLYFYVGGAWRDAGP